MNGIDIDVFQRWRYGQLLGHGQDVRCEIDHGGPLITFDIGAERGHEIRIRIRPAEHDRQNRLMHLAIEENLREQVKQRDAQIAQLADLLVAHGVHTGAVYGSPLWQPMTEAWQRAAAKPAPPPHPDELSPAELDAAIEAEMAAKEAA